MTCKKKKCGCIDTGLTTPSPCGCDVTLCPKPDPCAETFSDCCVIHNGPAIVELGIESGESLCKILEMMALATTSPACVGADKFCQSPTGLTIISVSSTTAKIGWTIMGTPTNFQVLYKLPADLTWTMNPVVAGNVSSDTIGLLTPNTEYLVKVNVICDNRVPITCASITTKVKTKL